VDTVDIISTMVTQKAKKNRRDHYLPQGYLRGFIHPSRREHEQPLWHFDVPNNLWSERSTREVGYRIGLYDVSSVNEVIETADDTFRGLENEFPAVRREMESKQFANWKDHLDLLLHYMQMMRARSILFFEQKAAEGKNLRAFVVESVSPDRQSVKLTSMTPSPVSEQLIKNWSIAEMREEINKGATWLREFDWCLRCCDSPDDPFITSEIPLQLYGPGSTVAENVKHPDSLFFFPLCWQACLIGCRRPFDVKTDHFCGEEMTTFRRWRRDCARLFLVSPSKLNL
jgi:hypothetical protein